MAGEEDETSSQLAGLVLLSMVGVLAWLVRKCVSGGRTVLVPVDQLGKAAQADQLAQIERIAVSNVSSDFLGLEAAVHSSARSRRLLAGALAVALAALMFQFPSSYLTEPNHYAVLEVSRRAEGSEIKRSFRSMSLKLHPDKVPEAQKPEAETKFIRVKEAYDALSKPDRRKVYERHGPKGLECFLDKSSICNVKSGNEDHPYLINDVGCPAYYVCVTVLVLMATGLKQVSWSTQLWSVAGFGATFICEMTLRGALGLDSHDWPDWLGFGAYIQYEKAVICRCWYIFFLVGALAIGALTRAASDESISRSYFNAILLQQQAMMDKIKHQDQKLEELSSQLSSKSRR